MDPRGNVTDAAPLMPGALFNGKYQVVRCIGAGGMGSVYEVINQTTKGHHALKVMAPRLVHQPEARQRFLQEAQVSARIHSDHIVRVFDAGIDEASGMPFIAMELLQGEDLGFTLERGGPLGAEQALPLLHQAALALDKTHAAGIVHRDLKPQNMFVTHRDDGSPCVKILDFGIAKLIDTTGAGATTRSAGTPLYMPPEQMRGDGDIGAAADTYALAHIAFTLLTGRCYWQDEADTLGLGPFLTRVMDGPPEAASARAARHGVALPTSFDAWFARAASPVPHQRILPASLAVTELASALAVRLSVHPQSAPARSATAGPAHPVIQGAPTHAPDVIVPGPVMSKTREALAKPRRWPWILLAVALLGVSGVGGWLYLDGQRPTKERVAKVKKKKGDKSGSKKKKKKRRGKKPKQAEAPTAASSAPPAPPPPAQPCALDECTAHELDRSQPIEALDHLEAATRLAKSMEPGAQLIAIHAKGLEDGRFLPGKKTSLVFMYRLEKPASLKDEVNGIVVVVMDKALEAQRKRVPGVGDIAPPPCNMEKALEAAAANGYDRTRRTTMSFMNLLGKSEWRVSHPPDTTSYRVHAESCAVTKKKKKPKK